MGAIRSFGLRDVRENGGIIGRPYTDMYDPDYPSLAFGLTGRPGIGYTSSWQTKWSNNFSVNFDPWTADSANLSVSGGILTVNNASHANAGAVLWAEGLTPGSRMQFRGQFRSSVVGGAVAYIWDASGSLPWPGLYNQSNVTAGTTFANFSGIVTVPSQGLLQFGLLASGPGVTAIFDNVVIENEVLNPISVLPAKDVIGNNVSWVGNATLSSSTSKYYGSSLAFPAVGDRVTATLPSAINDRDFDIQGYSYFTSTVANRGILSLSYGALRIHTGGTGAWTVIDGGTTTTMGTLATANTHHFWRLSRVGGRFVFTVNGTVLQTWAGSGTSYDKPHIALGASTTTPGVTVEPAYDLTHGGFMTDVLLYSGIGSLDLYVPPSLGYENRDNRYVRGVWRT